MKRALRIAGLVLTFSALAFAAVYLTWAFLRAALHVVEDESQDDFLTETEDLRVPEVSRERDEVEARRSWDEYQKEVDNSRGKLRRDPTKAPDAP